MSFRKILCLLLTAAMLLTVFLPVSAAANVKNIPQIDMRGFMSYTIYEDKDDPDSTPAFPPSASKITQTVKELIPAMSSLAFSGDWDKFGEAVIPAINELMFPLGYGDNGEETYGTGVHFSYPTYEEVAGTMRTDFIYDWRADPFKSAEQLNDFVKYLTEDLGFEQVCIECHSYGGIVLLTYLSQYGTDKVYSCCFNASAVYGAAFAGELLKGDVNLSDDALTEFLKGLFSHNDYELLLNSLADAMKKAGLTGFVSDFVNDIFTKLSDTIWKNSIVPIFGNWPSIWALCPDEDFDEAYNFIFGRIFAGDGKDHSGLLEKINRYNTEVRSVREEKLDLINSETNMYVIARYGYYGVPLGSIWLANTDTVLNTEAESFGATCKSISQEDIFDTSNKYVSPNGAIDASSCLFPDQTWFIRNCKHTQKDDSINEFVSSLLHYDGQATIDTMEQYPQYLVFNAVFSNLSADTDLNVTLYKDTFINRVAAFFTRIKDFFRSVFRCRVSA